jgi:dTDP-4-dehydrorhamnose reductase
LLGSAVHGRAVARGVPVVALSHGEWDVTDPASCRGVMAEHEPDVVVNCAAYTRVDDAEADVVTAFRVNRDGASNVAQAAADRGALLVQVSTDYVFDGPRETPWTEDDLPSPGGAYATSKWEGEEAVRSVTERHLIVRTGWLYGRGGRNFVDTIRRLAAERDTLRVVCDQRGRPTWTESLAETLLDLAELECVGTLHACDRGTATWAELAEAVVGLSGLSCRIEPVSTEEWGAAAPRPSYSVLALERAEGVLKRRFPTWRQSLESHLSEEP